MIFYPENLLTSVEKKMRHEMVYYFNPVLKYLLYSRNPIEFARYGFNSCRQTAIFGAAYMRELWPYYDYHVFEGDFDDKMDGQYVHYVHAFIVADCKVYGHYSGRQLLIDLSRTSRPLKFQVITDAYNIYDTTGPYQDCRLMRLKELDLDKMLEMQTPEYLTNLLPSSIMEAIKALVEKVKTFSNEELKQFYTSIYGSFTSLTESEVSMQ